MKLPGPKTISDRTNKVKEEESAVKKEMRKYSYAMAILIIGTALLSTVGWVLDIEIFKRPLPGIIAMNPLTALSWIFLGTALYLQINKYPSKNIRLISRVSAALASIAGVLRLVEIITDTNIDITQLLFSNLIGNNTTADTASQHMSSATAFSLTFIGFALFLSSFRNKRIKYFGNYSALIIFVIGLFSIIAHAYQVQEFNGFLVHFSMSVYTAICFFLISTAVLFVNSEVGFMRTFSSYYLGGTMSRFLIPSAILIPLFLGFIRVLFSWRYPISVELGVSLLIISIIVIFYGLIWFLAAILNKSDIARTSVEEKLIRLNEELEQTVIERTEQINKSERRFRFLVENNDDIISLLDKELKTIYRTPSSEQISGWGIEDRQATSALELIHPDDIKNTTLILEKALQNHGIAFPIELRMRAKKGNYLWLLGTITNMFNEPSVGALIANLRDITIRKQAEEKIVKLNEELEHKVAERTAELKEAVADLESFGYTVSHDLRTPLQVISAFSSVLEKKHCAPTDVEAKEIVQQIKDYTRLMSKIIESLLHLSQSGRVEIEKTQADMNKLVSKVLTELKIVNKNLMATQIKINPLCTALCDEGLITLIWTNLISNAIKYSRNAEKPAIEIGFTEINSEIIYYVKDNGIGFDMNSADKLFKPFERLSQAAEFEGNGIGLAIVKRIVSRHGGRIWAESKENQGAAFYFTLAEKSS